MEILSILLLIGCALRLALFMFDSGFGGAVWDVIMWISSLTWVVGALMAIHVLTGLVVSW